MRSTKPQDIVVLLALAVQGDASFREISGLTGVSLSEVSKSLSRAEAASLYSSSHSAPIWSALLDFIVYGIRHAFPAPRGPIVRGVPTSVAAPPLDAFFHIAQPEQTPVWPSPTGTVRGYAVPPLYKTLPEAAPRTPAFYELLALTDALREGRARERNLAERILRERLTP